MGVGGTGRFLIHIDAQDAQDFWIRHVTAWLVVPGAVVQKVRTRGHCLSQRLLQQPPVLIILCILCIDVQFT